MLLGEDLAQTPGSRRAAPFRGPPYYIVIGKPKARKLTWHGLPVCSYTEERCNEASYIHMVVFVCRCSCERRVGSSDAGATAGQCNCVCLRAGGAEGFSIRAGWQSVYRRGRVGWKDLDCRHLPADARAGRALHGRADRADLE